MFVAVVGETRVIFIHKKKKILKHVKLKALKNWYFDITPISPILVIKVVFKTYLQPIQNV